MLLMLPPMPLYALMLLSLYAAVAMPRSAVVCHQFVLLLIGCHAPLLAAML